MSIIFNIWSLHIKIAGNTIPAPHLFSFSSRGAKLALAFLISEGKSLLIPNLNGEFSTGFRVFTWGSSWKLLFVGRNPHTLMQHGNTFPLYSKGLTLTFFSVFFLFVFLFLLSFYVSFLWQCLAEYPKVEYLNRVEYWAQYSEYCWVE